MVEVGRTPNASVASLHPRSALIKPAVGAVGTLNAQRPPITLTQVIRDPPAAMVMWASAASRGIPPGAVFPSCASAAMRSLGREAAKTAPQGRNYFDFFAI